jgi:alpha-beta hydrolase superfamily lysophospholipase
MFEASVDGQPYDTERWGQYFRPAGVGASVGAAAAVDADEDTPAPRAAAPAARPVSAAVVAENPPFDVDDAPAAAAPVAKPAGTQKAEDILAMIRSRQAK